MLDQEDENDQKNNQVEVAMVKEPQVWKETEDWLKQVKVHSERFRTKLSIQVGLSQGVKNCTLDSGDGGAWRSRSRGNG